MISIIGGGPSGNYLAYLLAKEGSKVNLYEEHDKIGKPIQCTGLLTDSINSFVKIKKEFLVNTLDKARLFGPDGDYTDIKIRKNFVVDRHKFDSHIAEMAVNEGAKFFLNHKFLDCKIKDKITARFKTSKGIKELETDYLIGADGPRSSVGRSVGLVTDKRKYIIALQARMSLKDLNCEKDTFEAFMEKRGFGWVVPENDEIARVGIATAGKNANDYFKDFLKQRCPNKKIVEYQSGLVPIYTPEMKCQKNNVFLVGDAACQVKLSSLDYGEPVLIKKNGFIMTVRIGELVDEEIKKNRKNVIKEGSIDIVKPKDILSYTPDYKSKNFRFYKTNSLIRHPSEEDIYEIIIDRGYRIKVTGEHSVMCVSEDSFTPKKVKDLKIKEDHLLVNFNLPKGNFTDNINIIEWILEEKPDLVENIIILGGKNLLYKKAEDVERKKRRTYWYNDRIPLSLFLSKGIIPNDVKLIYKKKFGREIKIKNIIDLSPELFRLFGYYAAEGTSNGRDVRLCFGKDDLMKGIVDDAINCAKKVFGIEPNKLHKKLNPKTNKDSSYYVIFGGKIVYNLFKNILKSGDKAHNKEVPYIVFNVNNNLKMEFLKAYLLGDGHARFRMPKKRKNWSSDIMAATVSRKLLSDLVLLSFQLDLSPTVQYQKAREHELYGKKIKSKYTYLLSYSKKNDLNKLSDIFGSKKSLLLKYLDKIKEKSIAAYRGGAKTVIIPKDNQRDLEKLPAEVKAHVKFKPVENVSEVLKIALV